MIRVTAIYNEANELCGFRSEGHAGFDKKGKDIVCAGVSALTANLVNSVEEFTNDRFSCKEEDGFLEFIIVSDVSKESSLLLDSMFLGLKAIKQEYGEKFINLTV